MLTLCLVRRLPVTLPCLGPKTGPSVHPRHHVIPGTDFPLRRLTASEPAWQPPLSAWAAAQAVGHICGHDTPHPPLQSLPERELMPLGNLRLPNTPAWLVGDMRPEGRPVPHKQGWELFSTSTSAGPWPLVLLSLIQLASAHRSSVICRSGRAPSCTSRLFRATCILRALWVSALHADLRGTFEASTLPFPGQLWTSGELQQWHDRLFRSTSSSRLLQAACMKSGPSTGLCPGSPDSSSCWSSSSASLQGLQCPAACLSAPAKQGRSLSHSGTGAPEMPWARHVLS